MLPGVQMINKVNKSIENSYLLYQNYLPPVVKKVNIKLDRHTGGKWFARFQTPQSESVAKFGTLLLIILSMWVS